MGPHSTDLSELTPEIARLAADGLWLSQYYGQDVCTPSRAALMTGLYPIHNGMNHLFISGNAPWGLPLKHTIMPQYLKQVGDKDFVACWPALTHGAAPQGLHDVTRKPHGSHLKHMHTQPGPDRKLPNTHDREMAPRSLCYPANAPRTWLRFVLRVLFGLSGQVRAR